LPTPGSCSSNLGKARVYNISYLNAASEDDTSDTDPNDPNPRYQDLPPDIGLPPSPVAGMVTLDDGSTVPFCFGCSPDSPLEAEEPEVPPAAVPVQPKGRVYWYIQH
jgi:type IV pilus assembly protein PilY1